MEESNHLLVDSLENIQEGKEINSNKLEFHDNRLVIFFVKKNHFGSVVSEILKDRQTFCYFYKGEL